MRRAVKQYYLQNGFSRNGITCAGIDEREINKFTFDSYSWFRLILTSEIKIQVGFDVSNRLRDVSVNEREYQPLQYYLF